ncbi:hypothetical protein CDD79_27395 [Raoultella ornithinolytica]|nr:hypothetical protein CDD79_27395 [Raoultella ornithinolytica]PQH19625.1 hypothetical protein C5T95_25665 [Raoultella ornithinolytica]
MIEKLAVNKLREWPEPKDGEPRLHIKEQPVPDERTAFNAWNNEDNLPIAGVSAKNAAWLAWQARAELAGNSPVIPDGSASMLRRWLVFGRGMQNAGSQLPHNLIAETEEMLAAADCSIPMISDRWIPVSERMPPIRHEVLVGCWWGEKPRWCCKWATYIPGHPDAQSSGWLIPGASWTPTHWMPLPAAPQETNS